MNIYWDYQNRTLLRTVSSESPLDGMILTLRDHVYVTLRAVTRSDAGVYTIGEFPAGWGPVFEMKPDTVIGKAANALAQTVTWTLAGTGTSAKYDGVLDLNTVELIAAATANDQSYVGEFVLVNGGGDHRDSTRIGITIVQDVVRGGTPPSSLQGGFRVNADGNFQLWNPDTSLWHTVIAAGAANNVGFAIDQTGEA